MNLSPIHNSAPETLVASLTPVGSSALQKIADYLEVRYNLWKRRGIPTYAASLTEVKTIEKAAAFCLSKEFDPATYFQAQVDELDGLNAIKDYDIKSFYGTSAIERATQYRTARLIRDKALLAKERKPLARA